MTNFYEHIDDFKTGNLSDGDAQAFEAAMKEDSSLQKAVENHDVMEKVLDYLEEEHMREAIEKVRASERTNDKKNISENSIGNVKTAKVIGMRRMLAAAASVAVLIIAGLFLFQESPINKDQIIANHMIPLGEHPDESIQMGAGNNTERSDLLLWEAHNRIHQGNYNEADIARLENLIKTEDSSNADKAQYLLALLYFKTNNRTAYTTMKDNIVQNRDHPFKNNMDALENEVEEYYRNRE